jgi:hypothetical protein
MILENLDLYHFSDIQSIFLLLSQKGRSHANADAMSRRPCHKENCSHCSRTEQKCQLEMQSGDKSPGNSDIN